MAELAGSDPSEFGAVAFRAVVLPTDYRRSWAVLRRIYAGFEPDVVVHFGLSRRAKAIQVERVASRWVDPERPDAAGFAPVNGAARRSGPEMLPATLPVDAVLSALRDAGFPAEACEDAGGYVCNATLYRSLLAGERRTVGFVHIPREGVAGLTLTRMRKAASTILNAACAA